MIDPLRREDGIVVEARLDHNLAVRLWPDTGVDYALLTGQTALDLGPIATAEVRDADVAIDVNGRLCMGPLGMTFPCYFKVTVGRQQARSGLNASLPIAEKTPTSGSSKDQGFVPL
jgi:hypothetical protein